MAKVNISFSVRISILYLFFGALWILFSDKILSCLVHDIIVLQKIQLYKGWFFVLVTAVLLYIFIRKELKKRRLLLEQLQEANAKATESDQLKTAFLSNLSHYIRTPMNSILGFSELLEQRNIDDEKRKRFYSLINQQSQHLLLFINNIVDISKLQSGQLEVSRKYFHINQGLKQLYNSFLLVKNKKGGISTIVFYPGLSDGEDILFSDEGKIHHILTHLLTNAINYGEDGDVFLGYVKIEKEIIFYVQDSGPGLPETIRNYIFKDFALSASPVVKRTEGFGLGLYLSSNLAKLLGGDLWLEETNHKGSKFCFSVPVID